MRNSHVPESNRFLLRPVFACGMTAVEDHRSTVVWVGADKDDSLHTLILREEVVAALCTSHWLLASCTPSGGSLLNNLSPTWGPDYDEKPEDHWEAASNFTQNLLKLIDDHTRVHVVSFRYTETILMGDTMDDAVPIISLYGKSRDDFVMFAFPDHQLQTMWRLMVSGGYYAEPGTPFTAFAKESFGTSK